MLAEQVKVISREKEMDICDLAHKITGQQLQEKIAKVYLLSLANFGLKFLSFPTECHPYLSLS